MKHMSCSVNHGENDDEECKNLLRTLVIIIVVVVAVKEFIRKNSFSTFAMGQRHFVSCALQDQKHGMVTLERAGEKTKTI
jgi:hypothetical protein